MRTLRYLLQKEFIQISRDPAILRIVFMMPIMQLIILPFAADYEVKNINLSVVDHDHSSYSRRLIDKMTASGYFRLTDYALSYEKAMKSIEHDKSDLVLVIPAYFERDLVRESGAKVQLAVNAVNGVKGGLAGAYAANIIRDVNADIRLDWLPPQKINPSVSSIEITSSYWYNPHMNYKLFMVPGILVILVTMVGAFLSALNIVREKEIGTIEQLNVTPIAKWQFLLGKLIPFWIIGLVVLTIGLGTARLIFGIEPVGSVFLILAYAAVYLLAFLGWGLLISTFVDTQQQAMFISFFFMMIFIMLGGLYTNIDSMPEWAKIVSKFNPASYFIEAIRMIVLKGSGFNDIKDHFVKMAGFAVFFNLYAIWNYRKRS
ncbi:MAG: ABC transporter permease [Saprospiraceae bacterium]|nr:ABC transporter permease [Saprospiraceae bacterium]